ncbi:uroporphyrinogen decarboxylase 1, chloroplastic-like [Arachis stenosperma]|uniref:uroporphyrinogen decarboxylase 1, chloroplastic-like n=1 Tax=Arachis stenosperma TaxID=217475 RepID=UPI0025ABB358|nr:uroporphyrinogen decarboxylase 1, chloroplastic-like [Arachis stenosperma]
MREEEVASIAAKPLLAGLGSPSLLSCVPPLASGSPLCFCCNSPLSWLLYSTTFIADSALSFGASNSRLCCFPSEVWAHCIQIFDSWGGQLPPDMWERWSKPYIKEIVDLVKKRCPETPIVLYINGNGGLLERMKDTGIDVIGLDWTVDMADGRRRLGSGIGMQGNVDPAYLFSPLSALTEEI